MGDEIVDALLEVKEWIRQDMEKCCNGTGRKSAGWIRSMMLIDEYIKEKLNERQSGRIPGRRN